MKLIDRFKLGEVQRRGIWFYFGEWSVLNLKKLMETAPFNAKGTGMFLGWEAMKNDERIRARTKSDLIKKLTNN